MRDGPVHCQDSCPPARGMGWADFTWLSLSPLHGSLPFPYGRTILTNTVSKGLGLDQEKQSTRIIQSKCSVLIHKILPPVLANRLEKIQPAHRLKRATAQWEARKKLQSRSPGHSVSFDGITNGNKPYLVDHKTSQDGGGGQGKLVLFLSAMHHPIIFIPCTGLCAKTEKKTVSTPCFPIGNKNQGRL